jgi:Kef-type K+ transport system membrane component KefB
MGTSLCPSIIDEIELTHLPVLSILQPSWRGCIKSFIIFTDIVHLWDPIMTPFLQLALELILIITFAKLGGYLATRIRQPAVFGELIAGVILGPSLINITGLPFITDAHLPETISQLGEIGVLLLMFLAGLELHLKDLTHSSRVAALSGTIGVLIPVGMGLAFGELIGMDFNHAIFLGLTLGATSVSISAQVLIELNKLRTRVGLGLLGSAVFDDILTLLLLSTFLAFLTGNSGVQDVVIVVLKMVAFLGVSVGFGLWLLPWISRKVSRLPISQGITALGLIVMFVFALAAELLGGMAAITGTFIAGLMFARTPDIQTLETNLHAIAYSFFVPVFFVSIGLSVNLRQVDISSLWLILAVSAIAILGKVIGAGGGALLARYPLLESLQIGIGMISRGEVGLIIAKIGLDNGLLNQDIFATIVIMILITTLVTPPLLRAAFARSDRLTESALPEVISNPVETSESDKE